MQDSYICTNHISTVALNYDGLVSGIESPPPSNPELGTENGWMGEKEEMIETNFHSCAKDVLLEAVFAYFKEDLMHI